MTPTPRNAHNIMSSQERAALDSQDFTAAATAVLEDAEREEQTQDAPPASSAAVPIQAQPAAAASEPRRRVKKEDDREKLDFWAHVREITPAEWENTAIYVYRQDPPTEAVDGNYGYEKRYGGEAGITSPPLDMEILRRNHGGGKYKLMLSLTNPKPGQRPELHSPHYCRITGEPIIPSTHRLKNQPAAAAPTAQENDSVGLARTVMQGQAEVMRASLATVTDAARAGLEMVKEQVAPKSEPAPKENALDVAVKLIELIKDNQPKGDPMEQAIRLAELLDKKRGPEQKPQDIVEQAERLIGIFDKLKGLGILGGGGGRGDAVIESPSTATKLLETIAPVIQPGLQIISNMVNGILNHQRNMKLIDLQIAQNGHPAAPGQPGAATGAAAPNPPPAALSAPAGQPVAGLPAGFTAFQESSPQPAPQNALVQQAHAPQAAAMPANTTQAAQPQQPPPPPDDTILAARIRDCWERSDSGELAALILKRMYPDYVESLQQLVQNRAMVDMFCRQHPLLSDIANDPVAEVQADWKVFVDEFIAEVLRDEQSDEDDVEEEEGPQPA